MVDIGVPDRRQPFETWPALRVLTVQVNFHLMFLAIFRSPFAIYADNAFAFGQLLDSNATDREVPAVRAFNEVMAKEARLHSVIVPIGDGLWVGVKR